MTSTLIVAAFLVASLVLYRIWRMLERARERRGRSVAEDVAALGDDAVPSSIHPRIDTHVCIGSGACVRACPEKDVLALVGGQARLVNPLACIGHGACAAACPVQAITLVFGTARRGVELPAVSQTFETSRPGVYVAGELGGMGLIRNAVEQGRQAAQALAASGRRGAPGALDAVVVGAGPAGISATLSLLDAGLRVVLLEQNQFGGTIQHYPRAKVVMTGSLDIPRYGRVKRRTMTKEALVELWDDIRLRTALPVETGVRVTGLLPDPAGEWIVVTDRGERRAGGVILALGRRGAPRTLGVAGEDLPKVAYRLIEPEPFRGRDVLVVGGGNAAAESALALVEQGECRSVGLSYRRAELARLRAGVRARIDAAFAAGTLRPHLGTEVAEITPRTVVLRDAGGRRHELANDAVIVQIGGTSPVELLAGIGIATVVKRGEA